MERQGRSSMDGGAGSGDRVEAQRLLEIANKLLVARDLVGCKCFAERALESDPLLDGVDQILAVADVILASQRRVKNMPDWYSILQLPHPSSSSSAAGDGRLEIKRSYRHLALLLSPDCNKYLYADSALRTVIDAYASLSDPAKKSLLDAELRSNTSPAAESKAPESLFWTSCTSCFHVFEYERIYINRTIRCRICQRPFHASELAVAPPIVPGADMYYCSWGFFPLGFPGSGFPNFKAAGMTQFGDGWKSFHPVTPCNDKQRDGPTEKPLNAIPVNFAVGKPNTDFDNSGSFAKSTKRSLPTRNKKVVAKKRVGNYEKKIALFGETDSDNEILETGGFEGTVAGASEGDAIPNFDIDLEATEDLLSNMHDLPFV